MGRIIYIYMLIIFLTVTTGSFSQQRFGGEKRPKAAGNAQSTLEKIIISDQFRTISLGGRLEPKTRILHQIPSDGLIDSIFVREGQSVTPGDPLVSIKRKDDVLNLYKPAVAYSRIHGRVSKILVQENDEVHTGQQGVIVIGINGFILKGQVSDKDAFKLQLGQKITARTFGERKINGFLQSRAQEPDYGTGLFELIFFFPGDPHVHVGEFVLVDLPIDRTQGFFIPRESFIRKYGRYFIWIVSENETLTSREVTIGESFGDLVEIQEGLAEGDRYLKVLTGKEKEGMPVSPGER